jgi:hypothetical protein
MNTNLIKENAGFQKKKKRKKKKKKKNLCIGPFCKMRL